MNRNAIACPYATLRFDGMASRYQHHFRNTTDKARAEADYSLGDLYISTVTLAELRFGTELLSKGDKRRDELTIGLRMKSGLCSNSACCR